MPPKKVKADYILFGGSILTMDEDNQATAEAVAIREEEIVAVGTMEDVFSFNGVKTKMIYLNKQTLMPGFIEPHQHAILTAQTNSQFINISGVNYRSYHGNPGILEVMEKEMKTLAGVQENSKWGLFFGWDPELVPDLPTLSAAYLDATFPSNIPMAVVGQSGHVAWVNSEALKLANVNNDTPQPHGGTYVKDEEGNLTGKLLEEPAIMGVIGTKPPPSQAEIEESVRKQWKYYASVGFTTVTELAYTPNPAYDRFLKTISASDKCPIRLALYRLIHPVEDCRLESKASGSKTKSSLAPPPRSYCPRFNSYSEDADGLPRSGAEVPSIGKYNDKLWEAGVKIIADGSPHTGTSAVREPYLLTQLTETLGFPPAPGYGILNYDTKAMLDTIRKCHNEGKQIAIHSHGERAIEQVLKCYEEVLANDPCTMRHRMEHLGLATKGQIARAGKIKLALSFFVDQLRFYGLTFKDGIFGESRVNRWTPLSEATKSEVTWTIHQDQPTFPGQATPFANMKTAITRCERDHPNTPYGPEYRVPIDEALKAYTVNAAWQLHLEKEVGSITVGKKADLVVLSENPYNVEPVNLERIQVIETFLNGCRNELAKFQNLPKTDFQILVRRHDNP
ncbi:putative amidohydrolase YtcJ [Asterias rubens]|uniref:putative amidohydrolase YtcJ n=1 Tax=Asterias rubens TaxID=7604 RepID=UPI001455B129|nr:putative amidohydrolase YtcJ [Asterias rubens]